MADARLAPVYVCTRYHFWFVALSFSGGSFHFRLHSQWLQPVCPPVTTTYFYYANSSNKKYVYHQSVIRTRERSVKRRRTAHTAVAHLVSVLVYISLTVVNRYRAMHASMRHHDDAVELQAPHMPQDPRSEILARSVSPDLGMQQLPNPIQNADRTNPSSSL